MRKTFCFLFPFENAQFQSDFRIDLPRITLYPEMPLTVRSGEQIYIYCNATGEQPIRVNWHNEGHQPFPQYVNCAIALIC